MFSSLANLTSLLWYIKAFLNWFLSFKYEMISLMPCISSSMLYSLANSVLSSVSRMSSSSFSIGLIISPKVITLFSSISDISFEISPYSSSFLILFDSNKASTFFGCLDWIREIQVNNVWFDVATSSINKISEIISYLELSKQIYICKNCKHKITSQSNIINYRCRISNNVKLAIINCGKEIMSKSMIARLYNVSDNTVQDILILYFIMIKYIKITYQKLYVLMNLHIKRKYLHSIYAMPKMVKLLI